MTDYIQAGPVPAYTTIVSAAIISSSASVFQQAMVPITDPAPPLIRGRIGLTFQNNSASASMVICLALHAADATLAKGLTIAKGAMWSPPAGVAPQDGLFVAGTKDDTFTVWSW